MIISYTSQFYFLAIAKVASTTSHVMLHDSGLIGHVDISTADTVRHAGEGKSHVQNVPILDYNTVCDHILERPVWGHRFRGEMTETNDPLITNLLANHGRDWLNNIMLPVVIGAFTPTEMVKAKLMTEDQLFDFYGFGIIRDPVQRFLSYFFYQWPKGTVEEMGSLVDTIAPHRGVAGFMNRPYRSFFTHHGNPVAVPIIYENFIEDLPAVIQKLGGRVKNALPQFNSGYRPDWSKKPIEKWMPHDTLTKLNSLLEDDIDFYQEAKEMRYEKI